MDFVAVWAREPPAAVRAALLASPPEMFVHCSAELARSICDIMRVPRTDLPRFDSSSRRQWLDELTPSPAAAGAVGLRAADATGVASSGPGAVASDADEKGAPAVVEEKEPAERLPPAPPGPVDAAEPAASVAAPDGVRRSDRQRAREDDSVKALATCLALHERGIPIPPGILARVPAEDRSALAASASAGPLRPARQQRASGQRRRQQRQRGPLSGDEGLSESEVPAAPGILLSSAPGSRRRAAPRLARSAAPDPQVDTGRTSSESDSDGDDVGVMGDDQPTSAEQLPANQGQRCAPSVLQYMHRAGSTVTFDIARLLQQLMTGLSPTVYWSTYTAGHDGQTGSTARTFNEGRVLAMALEAIDHPDLLREILSRRLYGLQMSVDKGTWEWAEMLLPVTSHAAVPVALQHEFVRAAREMRDAAAIGAASARPAAARSSSWQQRGRDRGDVGRSEDRDRYQQPRRTEGRGYPPRQPAADQLPFFARRARYGAGSRPYGRFSAAAAGGVGAGAA